MGYIILIMVSLKIGFYITLVREIIKLKTRMKATEVYQMMISKHFELEGIE